MVGKENLRGQGQDHNIKHIIQYLSGTRGATLIYGKDRHDLIGYMDTDGATQEHRHAISRHVFLINRGAIS
jgi:hypothetical protein